jgi:chorismate synthase
MNTLGKALSITVFGTSHGPVVGCLVDGCLPGLRLDKAALMNDMDLRRPQEGIGTPRTEEDEVEVLSGVMDDMTTGSPVTLVIRNRNVESEAYELFRRTPRPGHADFPALVKYGRAHDISGGGQFSGRMTAALVAGGWVAKTLLSTIQVRVAAYTQSIGDITDEEEHGVEEVLRLRGENPVRCASPSLARQMWEKIARAREEEDSVGGVVRLICDGLPVGVGEPFFDTLEGEISKGIFAVPGVKGVEFGAGFRATRMRGSEHNDSFGVRDGRVITLSNNAGGVLGGLSNGMPLDMRVALKPTASIAREQRSVDLEEKKEVPLKVLGRHDPCIVPRAVVVVEAVTAICLADLCMRGGYLG